MQGGEIYIPKLPSMKIIDIIKALIGDHIPIKESGIRKGEKLHERLICKEEAKDVYSYGNTYCLLPSLSGLPLNDPHAWKLFSESYKVANDFEYISSHNDEWLSQENLYLLLKNKDFLSFDS